MIGRLTGQVLEKHGTTALIEVNGIGYEVEMPLTDLCTLASSGQVVLYTHFVVREDAQLLYGFLSRSTRDMFRQLIRVNGVGPKMGLAILSGLNVNEFILCVTQHDVARLIKVPGVGKKTAERLIVEMQDRLPVLESGQHQRMSPSVSSGKDPASVMAQEAEEALVALGYKAQDASRVVKSVMKPDDCLEDVIRNALKGMVKAK